MTCTLANSLWAGGCATELARFHYATRRVREEQEAVLRSILAENSGTEFGKSHQLDSIRTVAEYQQRVPLRTYEELEPWITRAASGTTGVLTREEVRLFEPTSGSGGASKLIPYTPSLLREFQRGIRPWIADLFCHYPELMAGQAFWSVSPVDRQLRKTAGGIPIGFDDDTAYVGGWQQRLVNTVMAVPNSVRLAGDIDEFRYTTLRHLVRSRDLRLISVWSPTYLSLLVEHLVEWRGRICDDLADEPCAREVRDALRAGALPDVCARLWPKLGVISCWRDANAAAPAAKLATLFPQSRIQGKGLIATEAFVSLPLVGIEHPALAIRSHFLEFLPPDSERALLAHELERGGIYTVVVSTGGGLYRYQLGDAIEVTGHLRGCPLIRFVGRQSSVSDWFGEKLNDAHVSRVFEEAFCNVGLVPGFALLACDTEGRPGYVLYIDAPDSDVRIGRAADLIDERLRENFHYDYARRLGQLAPVRPVRVRDGARSYMDASMRLGQRAGDIKAPALERRTGWSKEFRV